ncbi:hypothetical protein SEA_STUBBY_97 [Mycobacterium phage Stubby]|uniref:Uncharacterized protein n=1 Tax=Mycobacterium phage Stubby TaxID=2510577 RepID=A0A411AZ43_9CAUD|nr:hypothetical protein SEA_STUBBY_97 [Mycobacterium phage Stubby]
MRITSAREQVEMLSPWLREADLPPVPVRKGPGRGQANPGYGQQDEAPRPQGTSGDWTSQDWRNGNGGAFHSPIRPPMSSDIPHPSELGKKRPTEDPEHDPWGVLNGTGMSFEDLVQNHMSHHENMTPDQAYQGRVWYRAAHDATKDLSDKTIGHHGKTVAVMSAYSPKTGWDENLEKGHHFLTHYDGSDPSFTVPGMGSHTEAAKAIYHSQGDDWKQALTGPKRSAFANNILDPSPLREPRAGEHDDAGHYQHPINPHTGEPDWRLGVDQDSTIDTHHVRMSNTPHGADLASLKYETPAYFGKKVSLGPGKGHIDPSYDLHSRAAWEATRRINAAEQDPHRHLVPKQTQAGPWTKFKADVDAAGKGAGLPEPGTPPKTYNPDKPNHGLGPLTNPIPRYQRDQGGGWWDDPRRPKQDLRTTPNWNRRSFLEFTAELGGWWGQVLSQWIAAHPQHGDQQPAPERATTTYTNEPRRDKSQQFMGSLGDDFEPIAIHPEPHKIHPDWGGGEPDIEHRGYWQHGPSEMSVMSDWGDENGNINYSLIHQGDTLDVAQDPHEFLSRSPQELADMFGLNPETHDDRGHYGSRLTAETLSYVDEVLKNV